MGGGAKETRLGSASNLEPPLIHGPWTMGQGWDCARKRYGPAYSTLMYVICTCRTQCNTLCLTDRQKKLPGVPCGGGASQCRRDLQCGRCRRERTARCNPDCARADNGRGGVKETRDRGLWEEEEATAAAERDGGVSVAKVTRWMSKQKQGGVNGAHQMHPASPMQARDRWGPPFSTASLFFWERVGQRGRWQGDSAWANEGGRACPNQPGRSSCPPRASPLLGVVLWRARTVCGESPSPITFPSTP